MRTKLVTPYPEQTSAATRSDSLRRVPVLMYHGIARAADTRVSEREKKFWVGEDDFREHLYEFRNGQFEIAPLSNLWRPASSPPIERTPLVLTFDDGKSSDFEVAYPLLCEAGAHADFFVNTATIGTPYYLSWSQIGEMKNHGMGFHSHGHDHVVLAGLSRTSLRDQLRRSKGILEDKLATPVKYVAAPYGFVNRDVVEVALEVGYNAVCTSWPWPARMGISTINRIAIHSNTRTAQIRRILNADPGGYLPRAVRAAFLKVPKRIVLRLRPEMLHVSVLQAQQID